MARPALRLFLLFASIASLVLAGCIGSAQAASAKQNMGAADEAARAWSADARLAQVAGVEGTFASLAAAFAQVSTKDFSQAGEDETVGDGLAEAWAYRYVAAGKDKSYVVVLDKEGNVVRKGEEAKRADDRPLGAWSLDSDEAMEAAVKANADLAKGLGSRFFGVVAVLHQEGAGPVWLVAGGGGDLDGGAGGHVLVDAVTGAILSSEGGFGGR
jgi:hypothetical protein